MSYEYHQAHAAGLKGGLGAYYTANGPGSLIGPGQETGLSGFWEGLTKNQKLFLGLIAAGLGLWLLSGGSKKLFGRKNPSRRLKRRKRKWKPTAEYRAKRKALHAGWAAMGPSGHDTEQSVAPRRKRRRKAKK